MKLTRAQLDGFEHRHCASVADLPGLQAEVLRMILERARASAFVRDHGITGTTVDEYRARVPVHSYDDLIPYVTRMMNGEPDVLFEGMAKAFLQTSGTTSAPKIVPDRDLSDEQRALARIDDDYEIALFLRDHPDLSYHGRHLADDVGLWLPLVGGPPKLDDQGRLIGFISGYAYDQLYRNAPTFYFTRPSWLRHMSGALKLYVLARLAVSEDVRIVNGPPHAVVELARIVNGSHGDFLRDVHDGTLSREIPPALAAELPPLRPDPERARGLEELAARDGGLWPRHLWPRLAVVRTFCQAGMAVYKDFLRAGYGVPLRDIGLWSTEGRGLAYCLKTESAPSLVAAHRNFYELVDETERAYLLHEVERGRLYRLVVTSPHGLYRYDTGDIVEVVDHVGGVPVIEVRGRAGTSNIAGEKLTESHVTEAMTAALGPDLRRVAGFVLVPHMPSEGRRGFYELAIEYEPPLPAPDQLAAAVEDALCRVNSIYLECCVATPAVERMRITWLPSGWFSAFARRLLEERGMQAKLPIFWTATRPDGWPPLAREA
ncbi:MAG: GH3 auxin-responsive promoter family protein [Myxococcota bacterium]|nr:GH3 auxin-responsive promoter family protein [Myxococcota bacterium]